MAGKDTTEKAAPVATPAPRAAALTVGDWAASELSDGALRGFCTWLARREVSKASTREGWASLYREYLTSPTIGG